MWISPIAKIPNDGKKIDLGCYETKEEAIEARNKGEEDEYEGDCSYCDGDCQVHKRNELRGDYEDMIVLLQSKLLQPPLVETLRDFILKNDVTFDDDSMQIYDKVVDAVTYHVLTTENENI